MSTPTPTASALAHLVRNRFVLRQGRGAGRDALRFLGVDATDDRIQLLESVLAEGQCLFRDVRDRVALIQVLDSDPDLAAALDTNPNRDGDG